MINKANHEIIKWKVETEVGEPDGGIISPSNVF